MIPVPKISHFHHISWNGLNILIEVYLGLPGFWFYLGFDSSKLIGGFTANFKGTKNCVNKCKNNYGGFRTMPYVM